MTIYNVEISKIFKILNEMDIDCKYVNVTLNEVTNTVQFQPVIPISTKPKELGDNKEKTVDNSQDFSDLI